MTAPDFMPVLSRGAHDNPKQGACFMEFASYLAGEKFSDRPVCADPMLTEVAQRVNDSLSDTDRQKLLPLIPRVIGTRQPEGVDVKALYVRLACWAARQVLDLVPEKGRWKAVAAIEAAEGWCRGEVSREECRAAANAAVAAANAADDAADAAAAAAANAAYAAYAAAAADADAANAAADAAYAATNRAIAIFTGLLDEFDRLTGRNQPEPLTTEQLRGMAELTA